MKRKHLVTARRLLVNGVAIEAGTFVGVIESGVSADTLFSCISQGTIVEVPADSPELSPALPASDPVIETGACEESEYQESQESVVVDSAEQSTDDATLVDAGMSEGLASRLESNNITTVKQLGEFIVGGGDLVELNKVGKMYAKQIRAWWDARQ